MDPVKINIISEEELTHSIITSAKRIRNPPINTIIINKIIEELLNGKFSDEASNLLKDILGTKICLSKGLTEKKPRKKVVKDIIVEDGVVS